jgi:hypothetical protein
MPDQSPCAFSDVHTRAICDDVGDRLRFLLDRSQTPPAPRILALLLQLQLSELRTPAAEPASDLAIAS